MNCIPIILLSVARSINSWSCKSFCTNLSSKLWPIPQAPNFYLSPWCKVQTDSPSPQQSVVFSLFYKPKLHMLFFHSFRPSAFIGVVTLVTSLIYLHYVSCAHHLSIVKVSFSWHSTYLFTTFIIIEHLDLYNKAYFRHFINIYINQSSCIVLSHKLCHLSHVDTWFSSEYINQNFRHLMEYFFQK